MYELSWGGRLCYLLLFLFISTGVLMGKIGVISVDSMCYHAHLETVHLIQILSEWHLMQVVYSLSRQHNRQINVWGSSNEYLLTSESFPQNIIGVGMMTWILIYECWTAWGCIFYSLSTTSYHFCINRLLSCFYTNTASMGSTGPELASGKKG